MKFGLKFKAVQHNFFSIFQPGTKRPSIKATHTVSIINFVFKGFFGYTDIFISFFN